MSEAMYVPSVRRTVALVCAVAALASLITAAPAAGRGTPNTAALQVALKALHHYRGGIDGMNGRRTKRAVRRFQRAHRIPVDGVAGPRTRRKLGKRGKPSLGSRAMVKGHRGWDVAALQWLLRKRGFKPNGTDGGFGASTEAAVRRAQSRYGLGVDGAAGSQTIAALKRGRGPRRPSTGQNASSGVSGPIRFLRPVRAPLTSGFGMRWGRMHQGLDFGASAGTPVGAAGRGTVSYAGWNAGGYGNLVVIDHRLGFQTWYAHLATVGVGPGQAVSGRTRIGTVGSTGHSTGPHLHFEVRRNGTPVDPTPYLLSTYAAKAAPPARAKPDAHGQHDHADHAPLDGCAPGGAPLTDPATARLIDC
jgi:peptidoglycan hydrolase-like protein with peptidoglycan-binding domain